MKKINHLSESYFQINYLERVSDYFRILAHRVKEREDRLISLLTEDSENPSWAKSMSKYVAQAASWSKPIYPYHVLKYYENNNIPSSPNINYGYLIHDEYINHYLNELNCPPLKPLTFIEYMYWGAFYFPFYIQINNLLDYARKLYVYELQSKYKKELDRIKSRRMPQNPKLFYACNVEEKRTVKPSSSEIVIQ